MGSGYKYIKEVLSHLMIPNQKDTMKLNMLLLFTIILLMFTVSSLAIDKPSFSMDYIDHGMDYAVSMQLEVGTSVAEIISDALLIEGVTRRDIIEALQRADVQVNLMDAVGYGSVSPIKHFGHRHITRINRVNRVYASPSSFTH